MVKFEDWCNIDDKKIDHHRCVIITACDDMLEVGIENVALVVPIHFNAAADSFDELGKEKAAETMRVMTSDKPNIRLGNLGEIIATEWVNSDSCEYFAPLRFRCIPNPNVSPPGNDIIGFKEVNIYPFINFLKGEVKSREIMNSGTVASARSTLDEHGGSPAPPSILFTLNILSADPKNSALVDKIRNALSDNYHAPTTYVSHLIFTFSSNAPEEYLKKSLESSPGFPLQIYVGLHVKDYQNFVNKVYGWQQ